MELDKFYAKIATKIKYYRKIQGLTQEKLSEKAGISVDYLGKIEICKNKPGIITIFKIVKALNMTFAEFFIEM